MPKGRMLNRSISRSEKVARLSPKAALFFSWCIPHLDREGRIWADTNTLKGTVAPYLDYMTHEIIEECKVELHEAKLVLIYGEGRCMLFLGFSHNQTLRPDREKPSEIPAPTEEELRAFSTPELLRSYSGHKIKIKDKDNKSPSPALQAALEKISKDGFNIYALLIKIKTQLKQPADFEFPEEILLRACEAYWRDEGKIREPWPWFIKVLVDEWTRWNIDQNVKATEDYKHAPVPQALKDLLATIIK